MHLEARRFTLFVKSLFPNFFTGDFNVLDVGSGDINGNNNYLFDSSCKYNGNDVFQAKNVTIVCKTSSLPFENNYFKTICSTECFEHDPEYKQSFQKIYDMLEPGGLFFFTCASIGRPEHGTRRTTPQDSYGTIGNVSGWTDYYKNLTIDDLDEALNLDESFSQYESFYNAHSKDLYFWGIKKSSDNLYNKNITSYKDVGVIATKKK